MFTIGRLGVQSCVRGRVDTILLVGLGRKRERVVAVWLYGMGQRRLKVMLRCDGLLLLQLSAYWRVVAVRRRIPHRCGNICPVLWLGGYAVIVIKVLLLLLMLLLLQEMRLDTDGRLKLVIIVTLTLRLVGVHALWYRLRLHLREVRVLSVDGGGVAIDKAIVLLAVAVSIPIPVPIAHSAAITCRSIGVCVPNQVTIDIPTRTVFDCARTWTIADSMWRVHILGIRQGLRGRIDIYGPLIG